MINQNFYCSNTAYFGVSIDTHFFFFFVSIHVYNENRTIVYIYILIVISETRFLSKILETKSGARLNRLKTRVFFSGFLMKKGRISYKVFVFFFFFFNHFYRTGKIKFDPGFFRDE